MTTTQPVPRRARPTDPVVLLEAASKGDRVALARLLTQVESGGAVGRSVAALAYRSGTEARTVGITGPPGAGKSTLVDRLIATACLDVAEAVCDTTVDRRRSGYRLLCPLDCALSGDRRSDAIQAY